MAGREGPDGPHERVVDQSVTDLGLSTNGVTPARRR